VYFSYLTFFTVSCHSPGPIVFVSHFALFSVFLAIFHILPCELLIFLVVSFLAIFQVLQCEFFNFFVGEVYYHIPGPTVGISHF
jgi:hypothetical protein